MPEKMQILVSTLKLSFLFLVFSIGINLQANADSNKELILGIHPYLHSSTIIERFTPLTRYLSAQTGQKIVIRVGSDYDDHLRAVRNGQVDFAFMGPSLYIKLTTNDESITPLGRLNFSGKDSFRGAIIVRSDSKLNSVNELRGSRFAFGDPNSTLSSLLPIRLLSEAGIELTDLAEYSNLKNHHNVALSVLLGNHDAGGVKEEILHEYASRGLKALQWSPDIPTHLFVARAGLPQNKIDELSKLLQNLHTQTGASQILQNIKKGTTSIIPAHKKEYDELRQLISPLFIPQPEKAR